MNWSKSKDSMFSEKRLRQTEICNSIKCLAGKSMNVLLHLLMDKMQGCIEQD